MGNVEPQTPPAKQKEWHSTHYKLMKSFVKNVLQLSKDMAETKNIDQHRVAEVLRNATQLHNVTNDYQSEVISTLANIRANHELLQTSNKNAMAMYTQHKSVISDITTEVENYTKNREALTADVKTFRDATETSLGSLATAIKSNDKTEITVLLNNLANLASKAEELTKRIETLEQTEKNVMSTLMRARTEVAQAVINTIGPNAVVAYETKAKPW
jgi:chromosome segregation ATPase